MRIEQADRDVGLYGSPAPGGDFQGRSTCRPSAARGSEALADGALDLGCRRGELSFVGRPRLDRQPVHEPIQLIPTESAGGFDGPTIALPAPAFTPSAREIWAA